MSNQKRIRTDVPGVYQRGDAYEVRYRDGGRVLTRSFRTKTEARRFKGKVNAGQHRPSSREPFRDYARAWAKTYSGRTRRGVADDTRESYADSLERYAIPYFGATKLEDLTTPKVKAFIDHLTHQADKRKGKREKLAAASVRRYYAPMRALLATAYEDGLIPTNPAAGVRVVVRGARQRPAHPKHLTGDQTLRLLAEIPPAQADLMYLLATTAARISEALSVEYGGIGKDRDGRPVLRFNQSKTETGLEPVPLTPEAVRMLTRRRAKADAGDRDLIFPNAVGRPFDRRSWTGRYFKPAAERAGVPWASPHKLRHGVATLMAEQGYEAHDIAKVLRHADGGALAQRTYMHPAVTPVDFLDNVFGSQRGANTAANNNPNQAERPSS